MPKKVIKKIAVKKTAKVKEDKTGELLEAMTEVVQTVKDLSNRVSDIENIKGAVEPNSVINQPVGSTCADIPLISAEPVEEKEDNCPVPTEYRILVDDILNKSFEIEVLASPSVPTFEFTVIVPEEYSNVPKDEKDQVKIDRRTKIITYAAGSSGVKEWIDKIYSNFSEELKSRITQDRLTRL